MPPSSAKLVAAMTWIALTLALMSFSFLLIGAFFSSRCLQVASSWLNSALTDI